MAATLSRVLKRIISPLTYSGLLIGLHAEFERKTKFIIYADVIRYSFRIQNCLVKWEKWAEEKSKYRMKFQKDTNNFLRCIIEHGQILNAPSLLVAVIWCRFSFPQHLLWKEKAWQIPCSCSCWLFSLCVGCPTTAVLLKALVIKVLGNILEWAWLGSQLFHVKDRLGFAALWFS